jgi:hypothetical protein
MIVNESKSPPDWQVKSLMIVPIPYYPNPLSTPQTNLPPRIIHNLRPTSRPNNVLPNRSIPIPLPPFFYRMRPSLHGGVQYL